MTTRSVQNEVFIRVDVEKIELELSSIQKLYRRIEKISTSDLDDRSSTKEMIEIVVFVTQISESFAKRFDDECDREDLV